MPSRNPCNKWLCALMLVLSVFFLIVIIALVSWDTKVSSQHKNVCLTESCINSATKIIKMIDTNLDPCDDFYQFVCGNFIKNIVIPEEKTTVSSFSLVNDQTKLQFKYLLEQPLVDEDSKTLKLLKTVFHACMNSSQIETETLPFLKKIFKDLGGWPVIEPNWNERKFDWKQVLYRLRRMGLYFDFFLRMFIDVDLRNSTKRILTITQPYIANLRNLRKGFNDSQTLAYYEFMMKTVMLFGATELSASVEMKEVLEFEISLSRISFPYDSRGNLSYDYNPFRIKNLQEEIHSIPWLQLINNFLAPIEMLNSRDTVNVYRLKFLENLEDLLLTTNKRILANYMFWWIVKHNIVHLPQKFQNQALEYFKTVKDVTRTESRWGQCLKELDKLHVAVSSIYIRHFFNLENKRAAAEIANYIKESFIETLQNLNWMDVETQKRAILKAREINLLLAFPEELLNEEQIEDYYRGLELDSKNHFMKINLNISSFLHKKRVKRLRELVPKNNWVSQSYSYFANAFYNQKSNTIKVMAALLQNPFFDLERPQYMNFGSIGEVIAHEIIHGFDEEGKQFDENGNLLDWWAPETLQAYKQKSQCLIEQYSNITVPETGINLNGINTLNENIADNAAFKLAYQAYLKWLKHNREEPLLPGTPYNQKQIFWISATLNECAKYKTEALKQLAFSSPHTIRNYRILVPFRNSNEFAKDFNCSIGSNMNPEKKCIVW